jgi:hypothetical protein
MGLYATLYIVGQYQRVRSVKDDLNDQEEDLNEKRYQRRVSTTFGKVAYIWMYNMDFIMLWMLLIIGIAKPNLFHLTIMIVFVWAAIKPEQFK